MSTNERMVSWTSSWALVDGGVVCVVCKKSQQATEADEEFEHEQCCEVAGRKAAYPWVALHDILDCKRG